MRGRTALSLNIVEALAAKMREGKKETFVSICAIQDPSLPQKAGTKQVRQLLRALTGVRTFGKSDVRVRKCFSR